MSDDYSALADMRRKYLHAEVQSHRTVTVPGDIVAKWLRSCEATASERDVLRDRVAELEAENEKIRASRECKGEKPDWLLSRLPGKTYKLEGK